MCVVFSFLNSIRCLYSVGCLAIFSSASFIVAAANRWSTHNHTLSTITYTQSKDNTKFSSIVVCRAPRTRNHTNKSRIQKSQQKKIAKKKKIFSLSQPSPPKTHRMKNCCREKNCNWNLFCFRNCVAFRRAQIIDFCECKIVKLNCTNRNRSTPNDGKKN